LLLDEPTNHLDLRAKDVLLEALMKYTGTVVFVSHDRYFIDNLATRVFEIGGGKVEIYPGNYEDYLWRKQGRAADATVSQKAAMVSPKPSAPKPASVPVNGDKSAVETRLAASPAAPGTEAAEPKGKRLNPIKRQQMEDRLHEVEEEIARAEAAIALCETGLQNFVSAEELQRQTLELSRQKSVVQRLMNEWEEVSGALETAG
jgi:ATP-binding cassette subfamily F protein 3